MKFLKEIHKFNNFRWFSKNLQPSTTTTTEIQIVKKNLDKPEDKWDKDDYRMVRYEITGPKQVVKNWAYDLINAVPPKPVEKRIVWCEGGGGPLGHPKIFINLDKDENGVCGYCGLRFYNTRHLDSHHNH